MLGAERAAFRQRDASEPRNSRSASSFSERGLVVDAVEQRRARLLERFGGGDVGGDHDLFDEPVASSRSGIRSPVDHAVGVEEDLPLGQVEIERAALVAGDA